MNNSHRLLKDLIGIFAIAIGFILIIIGIIYIQRMWGVYREVFIAPEVIMITIGGILIVIGIGFLIWASRSE